MKSEILKKLLNPDMLDWFVLGRFVRLSSPSNYYLKPSGLPEYKAAVRKLIDLRHQAPNAAFDTLAEKVLHGMTTQPAPAAIEAKPSAQAFRVRKPR